MPFEELIEDLRNASRLMGSVREFQPKNGATEYAWEGGGWEMRVLTGIKPRIELQKGETGEKMAIELGFLWHQRGMDRWEAKLDDCWCADLAGLVASMSSDRGFPVAGTIVPVPFPDMLIRLKSELTDAADMMKLPCGVGAKDKEAGFWQICMMDGNLFYKEHLIPECVWGPHADDLHEILSPYWDPETVGVFREGNYAELALPAGPLAHLASRDEPGI